MNSPITLRVIPSNGGYLLRYPLLNAGAPGATERIQAIYPRARCSYPFCTFDGDRMLQWFVPSDYWFEPSNGLYALKVLEV